MSAQWDHAMQGIEGEAQRAKPILQSHQGHVDTRDLIPDAMVERGYGYTGEKMKHLVPRPRRVSTERPCPTHHGVMAAAERAEPCSRLNKST